MRTIWSICNAITCKKYNIDLKMVFLFQDGMGHEVLAESNGFHWKAKKFSLAWRHARVIQNARTCYDVLFKTSNTRRISGFQSTVVPVKSRCATPKNNMVHAVLAESNDFHWKAKKFSLAWKHANAIQNARTCYDVLFKTSNTGLISGFQGTVVPVKSRYASTKKISIQLTYK